MTKDFENFTPGVSRIPVPAYKIWVVDGLNCAAYPSCLGGLNGYVQLPEAHPDVTFARIVQDVDAAAVGYDYIQVPVHGGWTYGPDLEGWVGFDTAHGYDYWETETRRRLTPEAYREELEAIIGFEAHYKRPIFMERGAYRWTEKLLIDETSRAAQGLAALIRETDLRRT